MKIPFRSLLYGGLLAITPLWACADNGATVLTEFFTDLQTLSADFEQQVLDSNQQEIQASKGRMWIKRPGMFRWNYLQPYEQQIVADGDRLWSYDKDLEQVTVQAVGNVLTSTPASLLSGERPLQEVFAVQTTGERRVLLTPKNNDSNVTALNLRFNDDGLEQISAADTFGNTTVFTFSNVRRNPSLDQQLFRFETPAGADVVGDLPL